MAKGIPPLWSLLASGACRSFVMVRLSVSTFLLHGCLIDLRACAAPASPPFSPSVVNENKNLTRREVWSELALKLLGSGLFVPLLNRVHGTYNRSPGRRCGQLTECGCPMWDQLVLHKHSTSVFRPHRKQANPGRSIDCRARIIISLELCPSSARQRSGLKVKIMENHPRLVYASVLS